METTLTFGERLAAKRHELGATLKQLGEVVNMDGSTIRKLENGKTTQCRKHHQIKLEAFLNGHYDQRLRQIQNWQTNDLPEKWLQLSPRAHQCIAQITNAYNICADAPALQSALLDRLANITTTIMKRYLA